MFISRSRRTIEQNAGKFSIEIERDHFSILGQSLHEIRWLFRTNNVRTSFERNNFLILARSDSQKPKKFSGISIGRFPRGIARFPPVKERLCVFARTETVDRGHRVSSRDKEVVNTRSTLCNDRLLNHSFPLRVHSIQRKAYRTASRETRNSFPAKLGVLWQLITK